MSTIPIVKNMMLQVSNSFTTLETNINQLIEILNVVEDGTSNAVYEYIPTIESTLLNIKPMVEQMYHMNSMELNILFSELNDKTNDVINQMVMIGETLDNLTMLSNELYELFKESESMEFFLEYSMSATQLKEHISTLVNFKNELVMFKVMIDNNNNKLRVGVRK